MTMYRLALVALACAALAASARAHTPLFTSRTFTLTSSSVREGSAEAHAASRSQLTSTYRSAYKRRTERTITFKCAINGADNERMPGQDHHLTVNSEQGRCVSPVFVFGASDPDGASVKTEGEESFLNEDADVLIRVDMRAVLNEFSVHGFYTTCLGETIRAADFKGVFIAGSTFPLTWNFAALRSKQEFQLTDTDGDGVYDITIHFAKETFPGRFTDSVRVWTQTRDISRFPQYESPDVLIDALYNKSLEELEMNVRDDGAFMAGEMWPGVWTRDVSYSIILSLAAIYPDASKTTLMAKVKHGRIIQDTGTGGSWPVSTDRTVWGVAAWEVFAVTGDRDWLAEAYAILKTSADDDLAAAYDRTTGLFCGESSFLDWREQTYPRWMDPKDIYASKNLGTNAVHYKTYRILASMAHMLGEDAQRYSDIADGIQQGMNTRLWQADKGYYGQYLYGRASQSLSSRSEGLGEALSVLFDIPSAHQQSEIVAKTPVSEYGIPCIYPQIPNIPPYHNDAVWPFVEAFWGWASAKTQNAGSVNHALGAVYRAAALYLTNKENLVASTGDFMGTEINSSRQLWSVAGNLAMTYRILFGMSFAPDALTFTPFIPKEYAGVRTLKNFRYRGGVLSITIHGYGSAVRSVTFDGKSIAHAVVPASVTGAHSLVITMNSVLPVSKGISIMPHAVAPETPSVRIAGSTLQWAAIPGADHYVVAHNGVAVAQTHAPSYRIPSADLHGEFQAAAVDPLGSQSFLSEPAAVQAPGITLIIPAAAGANDVVRIEKNLNRSVMYAFDVPTAGTYLLDVEYANGSGPLNTDNKCALRSAELDGNRIGTVVMPQRGENTWNEWGYSNALIAKLQQGKHTVTLEFLPSDNNMNGEINTALVRQFRLRFVGQ